MVMGAMRGWMSDKNTFVTIHHQFDLSISGESIGVRGLENGVKLLNMIWQLKNSHLVDQETSRLTKSSGGDLKTVKSQIEISFHNKVCEMWKLPFRSLPFQTFRENFFQHLKQEAGSVEALLQSTLRRDGTLQNFQFSDTLQARYLQFPELIKENSNAILTDWV